MATFETASSLAFWPSEQKRYKDAEELYCRILKGMQVLLELYHEKTLATVKALTWTMLSQRGYDTAEELFERALDGRTITLGSEHTDTLNVMETSGFCYFVESNIIERQYSFAEPQKGLRGIWVRTTVLRQKMIGQFTLQMKHEGIMPTGSSLAGG